jgi:hypothetical protein
MRVRARRYMRVYNAAIKDRAFTYAVFFVFFSVHIVFCVWSAISPPLPFSNDWSHTGFICGIKARACPAHALRPVSVHTLACAYPSPGPVRGV